MAHLRSSQPPSGFSAESRTVAEVGLCDSAVGSDRSDVRLGQRQCQDCSSTWATKTQQKGGRGGNPTSGFSTKNIVMLAERRTGGICRY